MKITPEGPVAMAGDASLVFGAAVHNTTLTGDEYRITGVYD